MTGRPRSLVTYCRVAFGFELSRSDLSLSLLPLTGRHCQRQSTSSRYVSRRLVSLNSGRSCRWQADRVHSLLATESRLVRNLPDVVPRVPMTVTCTLCLRTFPLFPSDISESKSFSIIIRYFPRSCPSWLIQFRVLLTTSPRIFWSVPRGTANWIVEPNFKDPSMNFLGILKI